MVKHMVIRLNEDLFKHLLNEIEEKLGHKISKSYSEITGKAIFWAYLTLFEKSKTLDNKTLIEALQEKNGRILNEIYMEFLQKYTRFLKTGKINNL